jgi:hypothetical protein
MERMSDAIILKDTPQFDRELPPEGDTLGVCFNVFNLGMQETPYGIKPQVSIYFEIDVRYSEGPFKGKRMVIGTRPYTASLSDKANLRRDLQNWRGAPFSEEELKGWDIKKVKGKPAILTIVHNNNFADISGIRKAVVLDPATGKLIPHTQVFTLETAPDYVPKRVQNLLAKQVVQEHPDTDKIAHKGWVAGDKATGRPPTDMEVEIF